MTLKRVNPLWILWNFIPNYLQDKDLKIGNIINCFGRCIVLIDCDKFTKEYYQQKYGMEEFVALPKPVEYKEDCVSIEMPPYNGWGSFEDSEANCHTIQAKTPQRDMKKFIELDTLKLRFKAELIPETSFDCDREVIITYYLCDDTISAFEVSKRNPSCCGVMFFSCFPQILIQTMADINTPCLLL